MTHQRPRTAGFLTMLLVLMAALVPAVAHADTLSITTDVEPARPGPVTIRLQVARHGEPVRGAHVEVIVSMDTMAMGTPMAMPSMGMSVGSATARESDPGTYLATMRLPHAGAYVFVIHVSTGNDYDTRAVRMTLR
jgi:YtkA-like